MNARQPEDSQLRQRLDALSPQRRAAFEQALAQRRRIVPARADAGTGDRERPAPPGESRRQRRAGSTMDFSLFFFSGDGSTGDADKYRLLLEVARYADRQGYTAISVPERHFVDFGGLYPNPSVLAAALAVITERIQIRSGSVVLPLHHPVRVAEEWAVVDNLSGGRAAISCASGWHPDDFILAPSRARARHERRREEMFEALGTIQRLWRGETVEFPGLDGEPVAVRTLPRPVQGTLPVWISSQGSKETFVRAGEHGANLLTGLVGQQPAELGDKIAAYREARRAAGLDPAAGRVTVMVHTYLGANSEEVRQTVRGPLITYLGQFLAQQDALSSEFSKISGTDRDVMLTAAFDRYFATGALVGTPDKCESLVEDLVDADVDEVACLIDFGVAADRVLAALEYLTELRSRYRGTQGEPS
jgi:natural product biosynthesis luciferase-like monooxygenase protein